MSQQEVNPAKEGGVATITLNRPEVRNALSRRMLEMFGLALEECRAVEVRAVVITGAGGAFCTGADVKDLTQAVGRGPQELSSHIRSLADMVHRDVILKIRDLPKPIIASIGGIAAGAGSAWPWPAT